MGESYLKRSLPALDTVVGKYRIVRKLGEGGMGVVYEAIHTRIGQRVALKMLLPEVIDLPDVVSRFDREARAASRLKSENTARVLDVDVSEGGLPYMVMEFLDGADLGQVLERGGPMPVGESVDYVLQACNAMAEAHSVGVIHRDLKPSNLFVTRSENEVRVKVLDFGISKVENDADGRVTATQTVVGTPLYMSPEQVRSAKHVDARTDIWSLGIILYELLSGRTPFEGNTTAAAVSICIDHPPPLATFRSDVPAQLEDAILKALNKEPSGRFPNVRALAEAIAPFGTGSIKAPQPSLASLQSAQLPNAVESARTLPDASGPHRAQSAPGATLPGWTTRAATSPGRARWALVASAVVVVIGVAVGIKVSTTHATAERVDARSAPTLFAPAATLTEPATATQAPSVASASATVGAPSETAKPHATTSARPHATTAPPVTPPTTKNTTAPAPTRL